MKLRIVQVEGHQYAVQQKVLFGDWEWLSLNEYYVWSPSYAAKYCLGTLEQADAALKLHIKEISPNKMSRTKGLRITKVIKTVRV